MDLISKDLVGLVEHTDKFVNKNGLLLARAIINLNKEEIPLRIVNVNDTPVWNSTKRSLYDFCWFSSKQFMPLS
jgi:hypothetical protein